MSTVLIRRDTLTVMRPSQATDEHGWATGSDRELVGTWPGTLQWTSPQQVASAGGPFDPDMQRIGSAWLPFESGVREGDILTSALQPEIEVVVRTARPVFDPRATGELDCIEVTVEEYEGGEP